MTNSHNIARRLSEIAERSPHQRAVVFPAGRDAAGRLAYSHLTFQQLDRESDCLARGLQSMGAVPFTRLVLMVRFGIEFVSLVFAAFKAGAVVVLIDPGMGLSQVLDCLEETDPEGFLAIPPVHAVRLLNRRRFRHARYNLTVGSRWFWGGPTYRSLTRAPWQPFEPVTMRATDPAAVIFTSGSTGPAKGVIYEHGMFNAQVDLIRDRYAIEPGGVDLSGFPLFGLFNAAMGTTTVIPPMNPSKPAQANPARIVEVIQDQTVTQSFGSPALWERVTRYCEDRQVRLPSLRRVFSAGAPVPASVLERLRATVGSEEAGEAEIHTPYGAAEALPVCTISAQEVVEANGRADADRRGNLRGKTVSRSAPQNHRDHRRGTPHHLGHPRAACRPDWRNHRAGAQRHAALFKASRRRRGDKDRGTPRNNRSRFPRTVLAPHGGRRLCRRPGAAVVLRTKITHRRHGERPAIYRALRGDLQRTSAPSFARPLSASDGAASKRRSLLSNHGRASSRSGRPIARSSVPNSVIWRRPIRSRSTSIRSCSIARFRSTCAITPKSIGSGWRSGRPMHFTAPCRLAVVRERTTSQNSTGC